VRGIKTALSHPNSQTVNISARGAAPENVQL